jgi:hypothetical protein
MKANHGAAEQMHPTSSQNTLKSPIQLKVQSLSKPFHIRINALQLSKSIVSLSQTKAVS